MTWMEGARLDFMSATARLVQPLCHKRAAISTLAIYIPASGLIHYNRLARDRATTHGAPARNAEMILYRSFRNGNPIAAKVFHIFARFFFRNGNVKNDVLLPLWNIDWSAFARVDTEFSMVHDMVLEDPDWLLPLLLVFKSLFVHWLTNFLIK